MRKGGVFRLLSTCGLCGYFVCACGLISRESIESCKLLQYLSVQNLKERTIVNIIFSGGQAYSWLQH